MASELVFEAGFAWPQCDPMYMYLMTVTSAIELHRTKDLFCLLVFCNTNPSLSDLELAFLYIQQMEG